MNKRTLLGLLAGLAAAVAVTLGIVAGTASAAATPAASPATICISCHGFAPAGTTPQTDVVKVDGVTDSNGVLVVKLSGTLANRPGDVVTFVQVTGPAGGAKNLPADVRVTGYVINDNKTPDDPSDDTVGAVVLRVFGHQVVTDADGNVHLSVYRGLPLQADVRVSSGDIAYCAANPCS